MTNNIIISNAISINMLSDDCNLNLKKITSEEAIELISNSDNVTSIVGHVDTANVISEILKISVKPNRVTWSWSNPTDILLVAQLTGQRLPEGATTLPEGATLTWWVINKN